MSPYLAKTIVCTFSISSTSLHCFHSVFTLRTKFELSQLLFIHILYFSQICRGSSQFSMNFFSIRELIMFPIPVLIISESYSLQMPFTPKSSWTIFSRSFWPIPIWSDKFLFTLFFKCLLQTNDLEKGNLWRIEFRSAASSSDPKSMFVCSSRVKWRDGSDINWLYTSSSQFPGKKKGPKKNRMIPSVLFPYYFMLKHGNSYMNIGQIKSLVEA